MMDSDFRDQFRQRLSAFTSPENIERALDLGDRIGAGSRPDHELGVRLTHIMTPFMSGNEDLESMQYLASFAVNAWDTALMPPGDREKFTEVLLASMLGDDTEAVEELRQLTSDMIRVKLLLYPDDLRFIGDCDVQQDGNRMLITASVGPDYMAGNAPPTSFPLGFEATTERDNALAQRMGKPINEVTLDDIQRLVQEVEARATPDPEVSERLTRTIAFLLQGDEDEHTMNLLGMAAMFAWNASWRSPEAREFYLNEAAKKVANEDEAAAFLKLVEMILPHKLELFPTDERIVSDVKVEQQGGRFVIVALVPPDFLDVPPETGG
jgi:hypothetical protein